MSAPTQDRSSTPVLSARFRLLSFGAELAVCLVMKMTTRSSESRAHAILSAAGLGMLLVGGAGFAAGFFGPMALNPDANQGPMLGIFITGPGGAVLGTALGASLGAFGWTRSSILSTLLGLSVLMVLVILFFCLPEPQLRRNLATFLHLTVLAPARDELCGRLSLERFKQQRHLGPLAGVS